MEAALVCSPPRPALRLPATNSPTGTPSHETTSHTSHGGGFPDPYARSLVCAGPAKSLSLCHREQHVHRRNLILAHRTFPGLTSFHPSHHPRPTPLHASYCVGPPSSAQPSLRGSREDSLTLVLTLAPISALLESCDRGAAGCNDERLQTKVRPFRRRSRARSKSSGTASSSSCPSCTASCTSSWTLHSCCSSFG